MSLGANVQRSVGDTPKGGSVLGFYAAKGSPRPPRLARAQGVWLWDVDGRKMDELVGLLEKSLADLYVQVQSQGLA